MCVCVGGRINLDFREMRERVNQRGKKDMNIARRAFPFFDNECCSMFH